MANFYPTEISLGNINGGERFENGDLLDANAINAPIEASYYAQQKAKNAEAIAEAALSKINDSAAGAITLSAYPIGSVYISTGKTSPAQLFGGGWEQITDKFLLCASSIDSDSTKYNVGDEGGSEDAVIVKHTHNFIGTGGQIDGYDASGLYRYNSNVTYSNPAWSYGSYGTHDGFVSIKETGADGTGKNMPPYLAVCVWKRYA